MNKREATKILNDLIGREDLTDYQAEALEYILEKVKLLEKELAPLRKAEKERLEVIYHGSWGS